MNIPVITQKEFEKWVPAFTSADSEIFDMIKPYVDSEYHQLVEIYIGVDIQLSGVDQFDDTFDPSFQQDAILDDISHTINQVISLRAALDTVRHMDVTLTPTGFGIVRNDTTAPASPQRVDALIADLRLAESVAFDRLRFHLAYHTNWGKSDNARLEIGQLMWCPTLVRRYGIRWNGREVYEKEFRAMLPRLRAGEDMLADIISDGLYQRLVEMEHEKPATGVYELLKEKGRKYIAYFAGNGEDKYLLNQRGKIIDFLRAHEAELKEYSQSTNKQCYERKRFQSGPKDGCFFFS